ncbi:MAG: phosphatase PAP2 family protein [Myxococcota bacterium]
MFSSTARRPLYLSEASLVGYWVTLSLVIMVSYEAIPQGRVVLGTHLAFLVGSASVLLWGMRLPGRQQSALRIGLAILVVPAAFTHLGAVVPHVNPRRMDVALIQLDEWLFGVNPQLWIEQLYHPLLTEILTLSYASYYFLPFAVVIPLVVAARYADVEEVATTLLVGIFASYFIYMLVPARSPYVFVETARGADLLPYTTELRGLLFADRIREAIHAAERIKLDAFPSGHTAVSLIVLGLAWRKVRPAFWGLLPVVTLLVFSTVYLRYHYVVDVIAGAALAGAVLASVPPALGWWNARYGLPDDPTELTSLTETEQAR